VELLAGTGFEQLERSPVEWTVGIPGPTLTITGKGYAIARSMRKPAKRRTSARRSYHHGDLRRVLIATALELAEEQDVSNLTLREVARRAGVTHSAPYHHFPTKESLLAAVAEEGFRALYA